MEPYEQAKKLLQEYGQEKVLKELEKNKKVELIEQIRTLDFEKIQQAQKNIGKKLEFQKEKIESISCIDANKITNAEKEKYEKIGREKIKQGKYAVVTMAGGQRY